MTARVTLTITKGALRGRKFVFTKPARLTVGRLPGCEIRFPDDDDHNSISSRHCEVAVDPPNVRVRDLASRNGTFLNGVLVGRRDEVEEPQAAVDRPFPEYELSDGDELGVGGDVVFAVRVSRRSDGAKRSSRRPARLCPNCGRPIVPARGAASELTLACPGCERDSGLLLREAAGHSSRSTSDRSRTDDPEHVLMGLTLVRRLGFGAMGIVWLAMDADGREIAVKVLQPELAAEPHKLLLFRREIRTMRRLEHPHVTRIHGDGDYLGRPYFTSEYCDGGSLAQLLARRTRDAGPLRPEEALPITLQLLDALEYAHRAPVDVRLAAGGDAEARGIVHRDVSPGNILFRWERGQRVAKLADFGLAKAFDTAGLTRLTRSGPVNLVGKPGYMARQQALDLLRAGPEVDIFATAACLYAMLTGATPRDIPNDARGIMLLRQDAPPVVPIRRREPRIPARLADAIDAALVDTPEIEVRTATDLKQLLAAA